MGKARTKRKSPINGLWHIVSMTGWDEDYFNEEVQAFIEFEENGTGHFQFCYVSGHIDWRATSRDGERSNPLILYTPSSTDVEKAFPAIAKWVNGFGHFEIGDQEGFGFIVRAIDYGGVIFEDDKPNTLAEAMAALEKGLAEYFEREGIK